MTAVGPVLALVAGGVSVFALLPAGADVAGIGAVGVAIVGIGTLYRRRSTVTWGGIVLYVGVLVAGSGGLHPGLLLIAAIGAIIAWDSGTYAVELHAQLDEDAETRRATLVHGSSTLLVTTGIAGTAYLTYLVVGDGVSTLAAALLVLGAILVALVLEPRTGR